MTVDAHHHLTQSFGKAQAFGRPSEIFKQVWEPLEHALDADTAYLATKLSALEWLRGGFTTVADAGTRAPIDAEVLARAAEDAGIRCVLGKVCSDLKLAGPPEFQERAYGLPGLEAKYGCVPAKFSPINDSGGPLTVKALLDDQVQVADIFTTTPAIEKNDLVVLEDPKNNFLAQQAIALIRKDQVPQGAQDVINKVSKTLTTQDLIRLNDRVSGDEKASTVQAAKDWVSDKGL